MFRNRNQRFLFEVLWSDGGKVKQPVLRRNAEHQVFVEKFSCFEFRIAVRQITNASLILTFEHTANHSHCVKARALDSRITRPVEMQVGDDRQ